VDKALQRNPDPTILAEAVARFEAGCRAGDPAACSLLGVMHERGLAVRQDSIAARTLYRRACRAGNEIGCAHLEGTGFEIGPMKPRPPEATAEK
jgi:TPR repeat protein